MGKVVNAPRLLARLAEVSDETFREVQQVVFVAADIITTEAALSITRGSITGEGHVPSKPGQPPNADTRVLDKSIATREYPSELKADVVVDAPYARALEFGTSRMAARPFLQPAVNAARPQMLAQFRQAIKRAQRRR